MIHAQYGSIRQLLGELETLLTQPHEPSREEVEAAHAAASFAIRGVNERLTSIHQLIAAGRRAEAIEIAEGPPHVLDDIAILDSQLIRDWEHWSGQFGLPRFAPLRNDLAALVNGAYTAEKQLEHLLRRHRLLAIARANLRQRIAALSELAAADPVTPQWNRGLVHCQRVRLEQLAHRATKARKVNDLRCLQSVLAELRQTRWLTPVPKALVDSVGKQVGQLKRRESTAEAVALAEHIQDAYAAGDKNRLAPLIRRWREVEPGIDQSTLSEIGPQVRSVINWFDQEQKQLLDAQTQNEALQRIEKIDSNTPSKSIKVVINGIMATGAAVPDELQDAYANRVQQETRAKWTKVGIIIGLAAAIIFLCATVAVVSYRSYQRQEQLSLLAIEIDRKLDTGELDAAEQDLKIAPSNDDRFVGVRTRLSNLRAAEDDRRTGFARQETEIRNAIKKVSQRNELDDLRARIEDLRDGPEDQQSSVTELLALVQSRSTLLKDQRIAEATELMRTIRDGLKRLTLGGDDRKVLTRWIRELRQTREDPWIREESDLERELEETSDAVADLYDSLSGMTDDSKSIHEITAGVGNWERWESYGATLADKEMANRDKFVAVHRCLSEERELWAAIEVWNDCVPRWTVDKILNATQQQAQQVKSDYDKVRLANLDDLQPARDFLAACEVAIPLTARSERNLDGLTDYLQSRNMSDIHSLQIVVDKRAGDETSSAETTVDDTTIDKIVNKEISIDDVIADKHIGAKKIAAWFYFRSTDEHPLLVKRGDRVVFEHFVDLETIKTRTSSQPIAAVRIPFDFAANHEQYFAGNRKPQAPHVNYCNAAVRELKDLARDTGKWDETFARLFKGTLKAKDVDPYVQLFLLNAFLDVGASGSWHFSRAYQRHRTEISQAGLAADVDWIAPMNEAAATARETATTTLRRLRQISDEDSARILAELKASWKIGVQYKPVGWLDQNNGSWEVHTNAKFVFKTPLYVRFMESGSLRTAKVGDLTDGEASLTVSSGPELRIGRPVWVPQSTADASET